MGRAKKDGEHISLYLYRPLLNRLRKFAEIKGQTVTVAIERILQQALDDFDTKSDVKTTDE